MRSLLAFPLIALVALAVPPQGIAAEPPAALLQDAAGDVQVTTPAGPQAAPAGARPDLDLLSLAVAESADAFTLTVAVTDARPGDESKTDDGVVVGVRFTHAGRHFLAIFHHEFPQFDGFIGAELLFRDAPDAPWNGMWFRRDAALVDGTANTYTLILPRADLADAKGAAPFPGRSLEGLSVTATNTVSEFGIHIFTRIDPGVALVDRMPDNGEPGPSFAVAYGLEQRGAPRLASDEPFRASNGEQTTFIFWVSAHNTGESADRYQLKATKVPPGWNVVLPNPVLDVEPGGSVQFPVVANQPFSHTHGTTASFILQMLSQSDPEGRTHLGQLELGARYLTIPQPAGHHSTLYFHSKPYDRISQVFGVVFSGNDGYPFMNTVQEFEGDHGIPLSPQGTGMDMDDQNRPVGLFSWCIPLEPGLQMGLDFVRGGKGNVTVPLHTVAPLEEASLSAVLMRVPDDMNRFGCYYFGQEQGPEVIATLNGTAGKSIGANSDGILEGTIEVLPQADRIPYQKGQNIMLMVQVSAVTVPEPIVGHASPKLIPGGFLQLPLLEYHDDIKEVLSTASGPTFTPLGPQQRLANPGDVIVFPLSVANEGAQERVLAFNVTGPNHAWAELPAGGAVTVPPHGTARADLRVVVPLDAKEGDVADLIVQAFDRDNLTSRGLVRLQVTVTEAVDVEDDAGLAVQANAPKDTPGWAAAFALAALGFAAARRRT